jgi:hypothetical protein
MKINLEMRNFTLMRQIGEMEENFVFLSLSLHEN